MTEGQTARVRFKIGDAFPGDDRVAAFMVAVSMAWNDLVFVNMRLVGGDEHGPGKHDVSDGELRYLVRVAFAHLHELRECIRHARGEWPDVDAFLDGLPADAQADLDAVMNLNTARDGWIEAALTHLRHQTFHYGARTNWKALRWAMRTAATEYGEINMLNSTVAGMRLEFADLITIQHLARKFPDGDDRDVDGDSEPDQALLEERLRILVQALTAAATAAIRFGAVALAEYLNGLSEGVVDIEP